MNLEKHNILINKTIPDYQSVANGLFVTGYLPHGVLIYESQYPSGSQVYVITNELIDIGKPIESIKEYVFFILEE